MYLMVPSSAKQCEYRYKHHLAPKRGPRRVAPMASKETLMAVNQRLQLLLTKSAVAAHPSHILDLALLCIAALPVETCSVIAEVQKLRYALQNQELEG
ncbi:hypothetical protein, variant [Saprolegnia diclina VS20]|uniref:Uncharacterized protein n=1 Tax=Saprolegnia diclina (strain VS20) TaxID=1156394 RepID=T0PTU2_SAPDV|nr:hypothetical protein, variant [Saprolegnia diclina VS20]EQC28914.1 hypothetical protein, variant [Saprolegnia diclina VS20]|eukprot:XP_008617731.1 hypothetical protein, variant [Saprolegnia diclina VS20]